MVPRKVFVTGGTGYIGRRLITRLVCRGHTVRALVRKGSEGRLPRGCEVAPGNALDAETFVDKISPADTFVQLVGVAHPAPSKAEQFSSIDAVSIRASVAAAAKSGIQHFVYVSVAQLAPMMKDYVAVRAGGGIAFAREWNERQHPAALVRSWSRTLVACCVGACLLGV
jgi:nucleoside-diphosphate-sugar epimerase